jgi:AcrR family transcriptional regulator
MFTGRVSNNGRPLGRRSQREAARTRKRLLDRAERLFARKGYGSVSVRELARAAGVQPFTIQHHFGSKLGLYQAALTRWDAEVLERVSRILAGPATDLATLVERAVDELFELFLSRRDWVALTARAALGDGLPRGARFEDPSWVGFMDRALRQRRLARSDLDLKLLLITVEGILNQHALSRGHYQLLFGRDVTEARLKAHTKQHLKEVILALVEARLPGPARRGAKRQEALPV